MKKFIALMLVLVLTLGLVACGGSADNGGDETEATTAEVKGAVGTAGKISVFVPEGYNLNVGSITGSSDDDSQCYIQPETPNMFDYYWIMIRDSEENAASNVAMTKEVNNAADITITADTTWTGCHYVYESLSGNVDCGVIMATVNGVVYQVNFCGHAPESAELLAVLNSITAA